MNINRFIIKTVKELLHDRGLTPEGLIHRLLDQEVEKRCRPYVPKKEGRLEGAGSPSDPKVGCVKWSMPYAKYQYYGMLMIGGKPKRITNVPLKSHGGGLRGSKWFERMKVDCSKEIVQALADRVGGKVK